MDPCLEGAVAAPRVRISGGHAARGTVRQREPPARMESHVGPRARHTLVSPTLGVMSLIAADALLARLGHPGLRIC